MTIIDRPNQILSEKLDSLYRSTDRLFLGLFLCQWVLAIVFAIVITPYTWLGASKSVHYHVVFAVVLGAALNSVPIYLILRHPGATVTRHVVAACQMLWSAVFVHLTGGRIETHFHVFGSLAFVSFYRDRNLLITATLVVASEHLVRGFTWPESVYGTKNPEWWRFLEHASWVVFEDVVLFLGINRSHHDMSVSAKHEAAMERVQERIQEEVDAKTEELRLSMDRSSTLQAELFQSQKLEAVGRLASGLAHEINTPIQFVSDSLYFIKDASTDLLGLGERMRLLSTELDGSNPPEPKSAIDEALEEAELNYLAENLPSAVERSMEGLNRVAELVRSMKEFAHPDQTEMAAVDLNRAIENTINVSKNEHKYVADVELDLEPSLPQVTCHGGEINQVLINLIVNAAHAIGDIVKDTNGRGVIRITSRVDGEFAMVQIADTGGGIPDSIAQQVFEPFFTTKEVGKGTGQGLAIARNIVTQKHGGTLSFESTPGSGTCFTIRIPFAPHDATEDQAA